MRVKPFEFAGLGQFRPDDDIYGVAQQGCVNDISKHM